MKRVRGRFIVAVLCIISTSMYAAKVEVIPIVSKAYNADKDSLKDSKTLYGIRGNIFLNEDVAVGASLEVSEDNKMSDGGLTDINRGAINITYEPNSDKKIHPYAIVGVGGEKVNRVSNPRTNDDSQAFVTVGAGLKFGLNENVDIVTEARWLRKLENNDNDIIATVGLGAKMGESKKRVHHHKNLTTPVVTEASEAENAISLAKLKEIYEKKESLNSIKPTEDVVSTVVSSSSLDSSEVVVEDVVDSEVIVDDTIEVDESTPQNGYYVQMAALFNGDGRVLTDRLESKDYPYIRYTTDRGGRDATLILVGPYESKKEARVAIGYLKRLKSDAFIYELN